MTTNSQARESLNFSTGNPILAGGKFAPIIWDDVGLDYQTVVISINSTGAGSQLTIFQSSDANNIASSQVISISADSLYSNSFPLYARFFKMRIDNTSMTNQTTLNCQVIFKPSYVPNSSGVGADVNITNTYLPVSQYGVWDVNTQLTKGSTAIWNNAVVGAGAVSTNFATANGNNQSVSIFGNSSDATTIAILVSNNNSTYYATQYTYSIAENSDFGFSLVLPFKYLKLSSSDATTLTANACWC
jgi:hypothetical protein